MSMKLSRAFQCQFPVSVKNGKLLDEKVINNPPVRRRTGNQEGDRQQHVLGDFGFGSLSRDLQTQENIASVIQLHKDTLDKGQCGSLNFKHLIDTDLTVSARVLEGKRLETAAVVKKAELEAEAVKESKKLENEAIIHKQ